MDNLDSIWMYIIDFKIILVLKEIHKLLIRYTSISQRNGQNADGLWEVYSGIKDSSRFATVKTINGLDRREDWWEDHCAMITGVIIF